ncbi:unnamed protein product [Didymodactylos carnosus]|uniref:Ig-like domain-containing protein n=1 Tax=Didymodactylos carnosus TaxID=1234261 RepID=A0A814FUT8_9BILA|nr:unnamed protein product [Didymodactylos carnosus]CAF0990385.1 unnamed protein product [Didymodactylos carnosus]CAF3621990.1 unnamed protein product [Didymodactylos carnosus]CAF3762404.1 unnamed protein product [Didymodactylos carnosus]
MYICTELFYTYFTMSTFLFQLSWQHSSLILPSNHYHSDDYDNTRDDANEIDSEHISAYSGQAAKFVCDLPEKYSGKRADFYGPYGRLLDDSNGGDSWSPNRYATERTYAWTYTININEVTEDDVGEYLCKVGEHVIRKFNLTVLTPPKIFDINVEPRDMIEGQQVTLKCQAQGVPNIIANKHQLFIRNFTRSTPNDFECIADNSIPPRDTKAIKLIPTISPEINIQYSLSRTTRQGLSSLILNCTVIANPLSYARWKKNRQDIHQQQSNTVTIHQKVVNDIQLNIVLNVKAENISDLYGIYECEAENRLKTTKSFIIIDETSLINIANAQPTKSQNNRHIYRQPSSSDSSSTTETYEILAKVVNIQVTYRGTLTSPLS